MLRDCFWEVLDTIQVQVGWVVQGALGTLDPWPGPCSSLDTVSLGPWDGRKRPEWPLSGCISCLFCPGPPEVTSGRRVIADMENPGLRPWMTLVTLDTGFWEDLHKEIDQFSMDC